MARSKKTRAAAPKLKPGVVAQLAPKQLTPDPDQPRRDFNAKALADLADSIRERGIQMPILVRVADDGAIVIKDGERRWRAAQLAKAKTVPVLLASDDDVAQVRMDQVAVNTLREGLKPMELARFLVKLRDEQKLTPNDIASRLEKQGITGMGRSQVSNLMRLTDLPAWGQKMLDAGEIEATAARGILAAADLPGAYPLVEKSLKDRLHWSGKVTVEDVRFAVSDAYERKADALDRTASYEDDPVLFDWKKVCSGCPSLKKVDGRPFCLDREKFKQHQLEAMDAGLGPGGKRATLKAGASAAADDDAAKAERLAKSKTTRLENYLDGWLRAQIASELCEETAVIRHAHTLTAVIDWLAAGAPDPWTPEQFEWHRARHLASSVEQPKRSLPEFLAAGGYHPNQRVRLVQELVAGDREASGSRLGAEQVLALARHMQILLSDRWLADEAFLKLCTRSELAEWAGKFELGTPEGLRSAKAGELRTLLLGDESARRLHPDRVAKHQALLDAMLRPTYTQRDYDADWPEDHDDDEDDGDEPDDLEDAA